MGIFNLGGERGHYLKNNNKKQFSPAVLRVYKKLISIINL
jgi:hypothetical protein